MCRRVLLVCLALVLAAVLPAALAACQGAPLAPPEPTPTPVPSPTPTPAPSATPLLTATSTPTAGPTRTPLPILRPFPEKYSTLVYVGDYKTIITCRGTGEPTILLEHGLDYDSWGNSWEVLPFWEISRTCYYPRFGMYSEAAPGSRTTLDQVKELHSILEQTGIPGPYILVGHSIAGFNLLVYSEQYPEDVVGLVCVDCRHPFVDEIFAEKIKAELAANPNKQYEYLGDPIAPDDVWGDKEKLNYYNSAKQAMQVTSLGNRPFVVLAAENQMAFPDAGMEKYNQIFHQSWLEMAEKLTKLSTQGRMELVPKVTHMGILTDSAVTKAIQEVYDKVTQPQ